MFQNEDLVSIIAIVLSLSIPIVAIVMGIMSDIKKKKNDTELRIALIQQGVDAETAKVLLEEKSKNTSRHNKYSSLRAGCALAGAGLGALINGWCGVDSKDFYFWTAIAAGVGVGLLVAFIIEYKLQKNEHREDIIQ